MVPSKAGIWEFDSGSAEVVCLKKTAAREKALADWASVRWTGVMAVLLTAALLLAGCGPTPPNGDGSSVVIQGRIFDSLTGFGIADAVVSVTGGQVVTSSVNTDGGGYYKFAPIKIPTAQTGLTWSVVEVGQGADHAPGQLTVTVSPSAQPVTVDFPMYRPTESADISGKLTANSAGGTGAALTWSPGRWGMPPGKTAPRQPRGGSVLGGRSLRPTVHVPVSDGGNSSSTGRIVVELGRHATDWDAEKLAQRYGARVVDALPNLGFWVFQGNTIPGAGAMGGPAPNAGVEKLRADLAADPAVVSAEKSHIARAFALPNDEFYPEQWALPLIDMPSAWDYTTGSGSVIVAVIDSGIKAQHEDLAANLLPGWNAITEQPGADDEGEAVFGSADRFSHGTHVAGIIGAVGNNGHGVAGMNWNVSILPIKALAVPPQGGGAQGSDTDIAKGIDYAVSHGAKVINLSLGIYGDNDSSVETPPVLKAAIDRAVAAGVVVVAAAGNAAKPYLAAPANYQPYVLAVGAVGKTKTLASYSSYGDGLSVVAPGGDVNGTDEMVLNTSWWDSATNASVYAFSAGTSMAAPHVAGLAALLIAEGVPTSSVRQIIEETATDLGPSGWDSQYGYGLINAKAALEKVMGPGPGAVDLSKARVFSAFVFQDTYYTRSELTAPFWAPGLGYRYQLQSYPGSGWVVAAWLDTNLNDKIDAGDYWGEYGGPVAAVPGSPSYGIDITLSRLVTTASAASVRVVGVRH